MAATTGRFMSYDGSARASTRSFSGSRRPSVRTPVQTSNPNGPTTPAASAMLSGRSPPARNTGLPLVSTIRRLSPQSCIRPVPINDPEVGDPCEALRPTWVDNIQVQEVLSNGQCVGYQSGPSCTYTTSAGSSGAFLAQCIPDKAQDPIWIFKQNASGWQYVDSYPAAPPSPNETILTATAGTTDTFVACYSVYGGVPDPYGGKACDIPTTVTITGPDLLWWNPSTGALQVWLTNNNDVTGTLDLFGSGYVGRPVDGLANSVLWFDARSGNLQPWEFNQPGDLSADAAYSWPCTAVSSCAYLWNPIGRMTWGGGQQSGLLWHNVSTGELSVWELSGSSVLRAQDLSWPSCPPGACMNAWEPVLTADMNNDGNTDLVWFDPQAGQISTWLLDGTAVVGTQQLSWPCTAASGCASRFKIIGAADVNGDGHTDLTWWDLQTGAISTWMLDGAGDVLDAQTLSGGACTAASGCEGSWQPVGYVSVP